MFIKSFRISNYKSFDDNGPFELGRHMNLIVGQNSAGKTALLQAIGQRMQPSPHKNSTQRRQQPLNPTSKVYLDFAASGQELRDAIFSQGERVYVPKSTTWL